MVISLWFMNRENRQTSHARSGYASAPIPIGLRILMAVADILLVAPGGRTELLALVPALPAVVQQVLARRSSAQATR
jgi:UPF0716 family protein affecting phage T7 exclusion